MVAVKKLTVVYGKAKQEFNKEVMLISNVRHRNLMRLLGWSTDGPELLLVLEYMPQGSLDKFLWGVKRRTLNWRQRFDIIFGIARGLAHLHDESHVKIVHRDIKSNNILLDDDFHPKIADFGLARLQSEDQSHVTTRFAGTLFDNTISILNTISRGYTAPEYATYGRLSDKVDTYSFGIVVLEIISGRRCTDVSIDGHDGHYLLQHAWQLYEKGMHIKLIDGTLDQKEFEEEHVKKIIEIALKCTQSPASSRPTMSEVVLMLSSERSLGPPQITKPTIVDTDRRIHSNGSFKVTFHAASYHNGEKCPEPQHKHPDIVMDIGHGTTFRPPSVWLVSSQQLTRQKHVELQMVYKPPAAATCEACDSGVANKQLQRIKALLYPKGTKSINEERYENFGVKFGNSEMIMDDEAHPGPVCGNESASQPITTFNQINVQLSTTGSSNNSAMIAGVSSAASLSDKSYSYEQLRLATHDFGDEYRVGKGGFGEVFKQEAKEKDRRRKTEIRWDTSKTERKTDSSEKNKAIIDRWLENQTEELAEEDRRCEPETESLHQKIPKTVTAAGKLTPVGDKEDRKAATRPEDRADRNPRKKKEWQWCNQKKECGSCGVSRGVAAVQDGVQLKGRTQAIIDDGNVVAVKRLHVGYARAKSEFENEVMLISNVQHRNLVRQLGWCIEGSELLLVLEYIPQGSVDNFLWGEKKGTLNWQKRFDIIFGVARGLAHLHNEFHVKIIHRDIKLNNILVDDDFQPKICDFGLARLQPEDQTNVSTKLAGTLGYMAPEYATTGHLSEKVDTYSFGIVVLEIISGRRCTDEHFSGPDTSHLLEHAWQLYEKDMHVELIDQDLGIEEHHKANVLKTIEIALMCTQSPASLRPTMQEVVSMLSSGLSLGPRTLIKPSFINFRRVIHIGSIQSQNK
ncbi:hypothetical protein M8C21_022933 [Ambrosia artemisiifolia]|uniref:Protein kinase domain-containing protein n=1 Tax=Ambrosia artemisiifolia TaxID=4212 RepID=A0AAD5CT64_AMBAR|nr:hypothetical protein M8C21_022933 [Ambrosia artemisiifolia]